MNKTEIQIFEFNGQSIEFEVLFNKEVMVNATAMAKVFGKDVFQFTKSDHAKAFIAEALKPANAGLLGVSSEEDLIISRKRSGTWMHRVLAIKFAAWLNPAFELWIMTTIDKIIRIVEEIYIKSLERTATAEKKLGELHCKLIDSSEDFREYYKLQRVLNEEKNKRQKFNRDQLNLFGL